MLLTLEQFNAAYGSRSSDIYAALKLHLVEGLTITDAVRRTGASRSGVYKALKSQTKTHETNALLETWTVSCPRHHAATLHGLITRQLGIWEVQDARAAEQARMGVPTVGTSQPLAMAPAPQPQYTQQPRYAPQPQYTQQPVQQPAYRNPPVDRVYISETGEMYDAQGRVLIQ